MASTTRLGILILVFRSGLGFTSVFPERSKSIYAVYNANFTTNIGNPRVANGAESGVGVGKVLPFPHIRCQMFLSSTLW